MHKTAVGYAIGKLMQVMGVALLVPLGIALWDNRAFGFPEIINQTEVYSFLLAIGIAFVVGTALVIAFRRGQDLQRLREGYAIVTIGWLVLTFIGAIPLFFYLYTGHSENGSGNFLLDFTNAYFEIMSGFTTTGATILTNIEATPRSLLFLRALTHWLGGMGIITLAIVIFPAMSGSAYGMFRGEVPGPTTDKLRPRLTQTAQILWGVYLLFTVVETILLMFAGMNLFDAVCHTFATMATGGFSTKNASIAAYHSDAIEWIIIVFMYFAGINFVLHFKALRGNLQSLVKNSEFVFYTGVILVTILIATGVLYHFGLSSEVEAAEHFRAGYPSIEQIHEHYVAQSKTITSFYDCLRVASFQTMSIVTTTGFVTADFDLWHDFIRFLLLFLMFFGGCAGSTGGGMKHIRILVVIKVALLELRKLIQPRLVASVKIGNQPVEVDRVIHIVSFFILFMGIFAIQGAFLTLFIPDLITSFTASIATLGNIGPGLAGVGAIENYAWIPIPGKWILVFSMLVGRLEIFTVLIVLRVATWRK